jgi:hypothetical protein
MQIEPHTVEPGFVKRWTVQSIALLLRSPIIWGLVIVSYFFVSKIFTGSIWYLFVGGFLLMLSLEFACFTDFSKMNLNGFLSCTKVAAKNYIQYIKDRKIFLIVFCIVMLVLDNMMSRPVTKEGVAVSVGDISMFTSIMFSIIFGYIFLNNGGHLQIFTYPLKRAFDSNETEAISATCLKATVKNPRVFLFFEIGVFMTMIFMGAFFPITGLFFSVFIPCLIYVAFREIFWGKRENQKQEETVQETSPNMALIKIND